MKDRDFNLAQRRYDNMTPTEPLIMCLKCGHPVLWNDSVDNMCPACVDVHAPDCAIAFNARHACSCGGKET